jgi:hypothetical protein
MEFEIPSTKKFFTVIRPSHTIRIYPSEEAVRTTSISRPADIATSEIYNRYKELLELQLLSNQTGAM